ncbi:hypothetical protein K504DRAFT_457933 [Pleomassaria siparia CBS 279.74]|uniref:Zn(2)-C6 fungal-type domain-containing protein n=1 Tax=Pleomassaria siparia CBS 279.74 TaxID=1314801 RepID=A0A6G1KSF9_9PLEO|nr:hypothetical protein K504DRAFT_457933 [Pleomassaria siparia CBS 279.74]
MSNGDTQTTTIDVVAPPATTTTIITTTSSSSSSSSSSSFSSSSSSAAAAAAAMNSNQHPPPTQGDLKRKRSPSHDAMHSASAPQQKSAKTHNHLQINYLARHCGTDLPLVTNDDTLPNILSLLSDYQGVLDRHESMACNLGARPLGPILIKRFERLFDGPPRVLKSHGKDGTTVTWLDVVEFARNKPEQFQLGQMSEGVRVCQFYTKQCRVQISEEDFVLISSGIPQKMIPPQPIIEDEEKELGTLDILEKNLSQICQLADQVAARTRQLNHRLKGRKQAINDRRATASPAPPIRPTSPSNVALMNGTALQAASSNLATLTPSSQPSPGGFVAVNSRPQSEHHGNAHGNGNGVSPSTRLELMSKFHTMTGRRNSSQQPHNGSTDARRASIGPPPISHPPTPSLASSQPSPLPAPTAIKTVELASSSLARPPHMSEADLHSMMNSPVPIPSTPSNLLPAASQRASQPTEKDDGGPFKIEMVHRMESLAKGERILPPCDRCRRLHMDCLKNLTACMGCTKKHAKCSWKEVRENELRSSFSHQIPFGTGTRSDSEEFEGGDRASTGSPAAVVSSPHQVATPNHNISSTNGLHPMPPDARMVPNRTSTPNMDRDREAQLQEAAQSSLAHSHAHMPSRAQIYSPEKSGTDYQTLVA